MEGIEEVACLVFLTGFRLPLSFVIGNEKISIHDIPKDLALLEMVIRIVV
ncbi:hypothetical protein EDO6_04909 [Paenibacillus xylanexedens]|nr:hypothetical protein EDO6_04909 [Paenibacillus xylanexedens]